jgi:MFS family permease
MQMTATNWLLYQLTNSPVQLGLNGLFRAVPAISLGLISGTFADRYDRRLLLLWTQLALGLFTLCLALLDHSGNIQVWQIYTFTFFSSVVGSFDGPARQALFPSLVPRAVLPNAVALNSLLWKGAALLGPTWAASPSPGWAPPARFTPTQRVSLWSSRLFYSCGHRLK